MYYVGTDGGGTKKSFILINKDGLKLGKYITGTTHYEQIGFEGVKNVLKEGFDSYI
jgi:N-acetylglucosamine kinase-like BadF-type ATPase